MAPLGRAPFERDDLRAVAEACAQARTQVDPRAAGVGLEAPGANLRYRKAQVREHFLRLRDLLARHRLEVGVLQHFAGRKAEGRIELRFLRRLGGGLLGFFRFRVERVGDAIGRRRLLVAALAPVHLRQEHRHDALEELRVAPEDVEGLVVDLELLAPSEKDAREGPVEVLAPFDACDFQRAHRVEHAVRPDREARGAQHAGEVHDVLREAAVRCHFSTSPRSSVSITTLTLLAPTFTAALRPWKSPGCGFALADFETRAPMITRGKAESFICGAIAIESSSVNSAGRSLPRLRRIASAEAIFPPSSRSTIRW